MERDDRRMSAPVLITGGFSSGTTLLFTLFRAASERHRCFYEPLHERLLEYRVWPLRAYDGHAFVGDYFAEYKGLRDVSRLFRPQWGTRGLHLPADAEASDLRRYLSYLMTSASARGQVPVLKENRFSFRLAWLRRAFPDATIVHIHRDCDAEWGSIVRRAQAHVGREDVGQHHPGFNGFNVATWCEDLRPAFPELAEENVGTGYERFSRLWELNLAEGRRHADLSVGLGELTRDFDASWSRIAACAGVAMPSSRLRHLVSTRSEAAVPARAGHDLVDRLGRRYARTRVATEMRLRHRLSRS